MSMTAPIPPFPAMTGAGAPLPDSQSRTDGAARQLETLFLEEMLKYCGPGPLSGGFSGGAGEEQFASFLTREHAAMLSQRVDLGFGAVLARGAQA